MMEKIKRIPAFGKFLLIFALALILFWAVIVGYVYNCMKTYEAAQPEHRIEEVMAGLQSGSLDEESKPDCSRFEDPSVFEEAYKSLVEGKELTYRKAPGSYDAAAPVYDLYSGDTKVAQVALREKSSQSLMLILTLQEWEVFSVTPVFEQGGIDYTVWVPEGYSLYINDILADARELTGEKTEPEEFQYAAAYVKVPALVEYKVTGLLNEPDIEVRSPEGVPVEPTTVKAGELRFERFAPMEMDPELEAFALKNAKDYSNFFSRDLPGATASITCIRHLFPEGSDYLEMAEHYRLHDMWMYSSHTAPVFEEEKVENYVRYSEDFFSCEVSFVKKMYLPKTNQHQQDQVHTRFYYVKVDGNWVIADMRQILEEE